MSSSDPVMRAEVMLCALRAKLTEGRTPRARREWGGANVVISTVSCGGYYREVITPHAREVSWIFERLRDAFHGLVDSCSKFELYGRLELAANAAIRLQPAITAEAICVALLDEADAMLVEMSSGQFECLPIALGTAIASDYAIGRA